jgi:elongator complex protein 3
LKWFLLDTLRAYCLNLIHSIEAGEIKTRQQLNEKKIEFCKKHSLPQMPKNSVILSFAKPFSLHEKALGKQPSAKPFFLTEKILGKFASQEKSETLLRLLSVKPTRGLSGIAIVAVMTKPHKCPGKCIYCPSSLLPGKLTPKSYTGREPATMRAISANFDPEQQINDRLRQLQEAGHPTNKIELIVMGGTFLSQQLSFQKKFMLSCLNAFNGKKSKTINAAAKAAESAENRITGITFETRPDFCGEKEINNLLSFGGTRCELGVQTIYDSVYKKINRGHTIADVINATQLLKDSAFKVTYHYMPGLPGVSFLEDKKALREIFSSPEFKPDSLKIYPCLVIEGTKLFKQWQRGSYKPFSTEKAVKLLAEMKGFVPRWVRIMRVQRDIPSQLIAAGVQKSNLRQLVQRKAAAEGIECECIRCREAGLRAYKEGISADSSDAELFVEKYNASNGQEFFISFEDKARKFLYGFLRLRQPFAVAKAWGKGASRQSFAPFRKEIDGRTALVRELRVFGEPLPLHKRSDEAIQHKGIGKMLLRKAEEIAESELDARKLSVLSGFGVKQYYFDLGFKRDGCYVAKTFK